MSENRQQRARLRYVLLAALSPLALLFLWIAATRHGWVRPVILPPPDAVVMSFVDMVASGYSGVPLYAHVAASLMRVGVAFFVGALLGIVIGMLRGRVAEVDAIFVVPSEMLRPIPPLGLIPLFILWFGIGELSKILLILTSVFLITMVNAQAGARACPADPLRAALSLGADRFQVFRYVVLPAALPQIMTGSTRGSGNGAVHSRGLGAARRRSGIGIHRARCQQFLSHHVCLFGRDHYRHRGSGERPRTRMALASLGALGGTAVAVRG
jgi:taurine transport system permease protein